MRVVITNDKIEDEEEDIESQKYVPQLKGYSKITILKKIKE